MPNQLWSQDSFNQGELSPLMYAKSTVNQYHNALKTAQNVLCFPQGGAGKRFGTLFRSVITGFTSADDIFFEAFQYLNECTYQILFYSDTIKIYLEGLLITTITSTGLDAAAVRSLDYTVLDNLFRVAGQGFPFPPSDLARFPNAVDVITGVTGNRFNLTNALQANVVLPVKFTNTGGALPVTVPAIKAGITYFAWFYTASQVGIFSTSEDAANQLNQYTISSAGTGTNNLIPQNTWTFTAANYKNRPVFDFGDVNYDAISFKVDVVTGNNISLHSTSAVFTAAHVGGAFFGLGGVGRIITFTSTTQVQLTITKPFPNTDNFLGTFALLTEPAWSNARGWPQKCSSYQNRALFANTESLPNGFWASSINDYSDFDDTETDDDDAISWYPTSDDINYIRFIVPYRSLTIHTNSGVYSSPLSANSAITPTNFSLQLNDSTPADNLTPRGIDNQIIVSSGNDVYALVWDGINNAYTSEIVSILNEQVIRNPVDEAAYVDLTRGGSRYVFFINELGSMAIFQTLLTEGIKGWTPSVTEQYYGASYFRQVITSHTGRGWFLNERYIAAVGSTYNISGFTGGVHSNLITSAPNTFSTTEAQAVKFTTTGSLPVSSPQIVTGTYYWVIAVDTTHFKVYSNIEDANADTNSYTFTSAGTSSHVVAWPATKTFFLEELTFDTFLDCATYYNSTATSTITGQSRFNAQNVKMVGDGFGFETQGNNDVINFEAHGVAVQVSLAYIGFPINTIMEPMPLAMSNGGSLRNSTLTRPKHIRSVNFMFDNTIGGTINGVPIAIKTFDQVGIGEPPVPASGIFEMGIMKGWDDFNNPSFTIVHNDPFDIRLLGLFYSVDT